MTMLLHLMGPTCAGKSSLIRRLCEIEPERVGAVEVGKMLREKYGEDYFRGQAAPEHTQDEAWSMYVNGVKAQVNYGKSLILIDGQPRDQKQAVDAIGRWSRPMYSSFVMVHADHDTRERRAKTSRVGSSRKLAMKRMMNDYRNCYTVMVQLLALDVPIRILDTSRQSTEAIAEQILAEYLGATKA